MENPSKKSVIVVFSFFLLLLSACLTLSTIGAIKALCTKNWPTTTGSVISSEVQQGKSSKGSPKFKPVINYSYVIDKEEYFSNNYSSTPARGSSLWAKQVISQYPDNSVINVYYNPKDLNDSVLSTGLQYDNYWMVLLSLFFFAVVLFAFIKQLKKID
jgi:hypothetical protein